MDNKWYIQYNDTQIGPMRKDELLAYDLRPDSMVWNPELPQWQPAYMIPELMTLIKDSKTHMPPPIIDTGAPNRVLAALLAIFIGSLGVQYFYCGKTTAGFLTILLTVVTCGLWGFITLVQGIYMLTISDEQFYAKYVAGTSTLPLF